MPTLTWGFLMLNFLMSKLKLKNQPIKTRQKLTHKTHQSPIRNQPENLKTRKRPPKKAVPKASPRSFKTRSFNNSIDPLEPVDRRESKRKCYWFATAVKSNVFE